LSRKTGSSGAERKPKQHEEYPEIFLSQNTTDGDRIQINFGGFVSLSTIDWRGKSVCTVFLRGCPLRCSYCQNEEIQDGEDWRDIQEIFEMIRTSSPFISGVIFSGGEPTLQKEGLIALARYTKNLGLAVGIQTNGFFPDTLESLLSEGLADKVALDYKTTWEGYSGSAAGSHLLVKNNYGKNVLKSIDLCKNAFKKSALDDFEIVFTIFYENMEYLREISRKIGDVPLVLQQGEHKMAVLNMSSPEMTRGEYISKKRVQQERHPPLTLQEIKEIANKIGRPVRIRVRGEGEIAYFMKVIGVVGMPASGKGEFAKIASDMGIPVIVMGDMIRNAVKTAGLEPTDTNFGLTASRLRAEQGMDAVAKLCIPEVEHQTAPLVLIDGIRGDSEVKRFRKAFPSFTLINIDSTFDNRLVRVAARGRTDDVHTAEELRNRDERELGWGLGKAQKMSDVQIKNNGTLDDFSKAVHRLLDKIRKDP